MERRFRASSLTDAGQIAIIGICGWGGIALNAAAQDPRIKATAAITMYDMSRVSGNGYFDADDSEESRIPCQRTNNFSSFQKPLIATFTMVAEGG